MNSFIPWVGGMLVTNPIPEEYSMDHKVIDAAIEQALADAKAQGIHGKETTHFLMARVKDLTGGDSLDSNIQLVYNNARLAAKTACASVISRRRTPAFFRLVVSLRSARILPGAAVKWAKRLSLSPRGETCRTIKSPVIMPMQAISWIIVIHLPPFLERIVPTLQAASRFQ